MVYNINYVICSCISTTKNLGAKYLHQTILNLSDNRSIIAKTRQAAISLADGKALSHIFCSLCIKINFQCTLHFVNSKLNVIIDDISQIKSCLSESSLQQLFQDHMELISCKQFHLNPDFISCLVHVVLHVMLSVSLLMKPFSAKLSRRQLQSNFISRMLQNSKFSKIYLTLD